MMILPNNSSASSVPMLNNFASTLPPQNSTTMIASNANPWAITPQEHQGNESQFAVLRPFGNPPMIGGEQARPFFLKSGLPATILAQIWQLADLNKDGKLDRLEFSIAMKLVRNCLAGLPLPPNLPDSMRQISGISPQPLAMGPFNGAAPPPQMPPRPMSTYGTIPAMSSNYRPPPPPYGGSYSAAQTPTHAGGPLPFQMGTKELGDWTLPQPMKLRFCQQFNQLDRSRVGLLTGQQARGVLGESQLPTQLLAQIWTMSDVNKDGCLSIEEFCTAQFLIDMIKAGYALPPRLPNELYAFCNRSRTVSPSTVSSTPTDPNAPPPQKGGGGGQHKTFEDKRRDNLDKGQAELDRRRQILREEEERRRAEIERREREEAERRERERLELERRREAEMEVERQRELERERERAAEEERMKTQREKARRMLEMERIKELEKIRVRDLENQLQAETEKTTQIQQRQKTMAFQLQALDERSQQLNTDITGSRDKILEITQEIEGMRGTRDAKCARIQELERRAREFNVQSERFGHENLQLQSECQRQLSRTNEIEALGKELAGIDEEIARMEAETQTVGGRATNQEKVVEEKRPDWERSCAEFKTVEGAHDELLKQYNQRRREVHPASVAAVVAPPQYEMPPDTAAFGQIARRTSDFTPNFAAAFGGEPERQKSIESEAARRKSESASIGSVASIAAKLQQQLQFQPPQQKQASLSREGSVASGGKPAIPASASIDGLQQQQSAAAVIGANVKPVKYRALYEFNARSGDELTLQPGDTILAFEGHQSEPGWLAGQIRDKVGWFPAAFAEPMASSTSPSPAATAVVLKKAGSLTGSPSGEPLASIQEEAEMTASSAATIVEKQAEAAPFVADFASAFSKSVSMTDTSLSALAAAPQPSAISASRSTGTFAAGALYDLPPSDDLLGKKPLAVAEKPAATAPPPLYEMPPVDGGGAEVLGTGAALYQWKARNEQEMSFARGDIIEVLEQGEMRWRGRLQKNRQTQGWFPKSYIKMATGPGPTGNGTAGVKGGGGGGKEEERRGSGPLLNGKGGGGQETAAAAGQRKPSQTAGTEKGGADWFIALYQFDAVEPTDLSLKPGDRIMVIDQRDQWWRGTCEGRTGIFPANYVQRAAEFAGNTTAGVAPNADQADKQTIGRAIAAFEATASNQISLHIGDIVRVHQQTPGGWWEGELDRGGEKQVGWFPGNYIQIVPSQQAGEKLLTVAAFDYQAQHDDELSFKAGDVIEVMDRADAQWWKGRKQGDTAQQQPLLFPANFVQLR